MAGLQGWQLVIIILIALLLFAAPKLPTMARNLGQSMRIFSSEVKEMRNEGKEKKANSEATGETVPGETVENHAEKRPQAGDTGSHSADGDVR